MTMLSFRVDSDEANQIRNLADSLGVDRSEFLRQAARMYVLKIKSEEDASIWEEKPLSSEEQQLAEIADWGPAEDWADWRQS